MTTKKSKAPLSEGTLTETQRVLKEVSSAQQRADDWVAAKKAGVLDPLRQSTVAISTPSGTPSRIEQFIESLLGEEAAIGTVTQDDADRMLDAVEQQSLIMGSDLTDEEKDSISERALEMWWMDNPDLIERSFVESGFSRQEAAEATDHLEEAQDLDPSERRNVIVNKLIGMSDQSQESSEKILEKLKKKDTGEMEIDL